MPTNVIEKRLDEIAGLLNGTIAGDESLLIRGVTNIDNASPGHITFATNLDNLKKAEQTQAPAVIVPEEITESKKTILRVKNPRLALAQVITLFQESPTSPEGIHPTASIDNSAAVHPTASIGAFVVIGKNARVGAHTKIHPHTVIGQDACVGEHCIFHPQTTLYPRSIIGNRVILHAGVVVGSDGFGYVEKDSIQHKVPQVGNVVVEDDVEIGAGTCIDCATMGSTVIGSGTKIDNLVQIAHNNQIGKNCIIISQAGISGSVRVGNNVVIAGKVGIKDHVTIGDRAMIVATSAVSQDLKGGQIYAGIPAKPFTEAKRQWAALALLPAFMKRLGLLPELIKNIELRLKALEEKLNP